MALHSFREQQVPSTDGVPQPGNPSGKFSDVAALHQRVQVIKPPHLISYILKDVEILYGVVWQLQLILGVTSHPCMPVPKQ